MTVRHKRPLLLAALAALCVVMIGDNARFALTTRPTEIAFDARHTVDGRSYEAGAARFVEGGIFAVLSGDPCRSPGQQIFAGVVATSFGSGPIPIRVALVIAHVLASLFAGLLAYRLHPDRHLAAVTTLATLASNSLSRYAASYQYETLAACLVVAVVWLLATRPERPWGALVAGVLTAVLCIVRVHFLVIAIGALAALLWLARIEGKKAYRAAGAYLAGFLALSVPWCLAISSVEGEPVLFHTACRVGVYNHMNDLGHSYPYRDAVEPRGLAMVLEEPLAYLRLVARRVLILWDGDRDIWKVAVPFEERAAALGLRIPYRIVFTLAFFAASLLGAVSFFRARRREPRACALLFVSAATVAAPMLLCLFMGSSPRYLVPVIPVLVAFQGYGLWSARRSPASSSGSPASTG